MIDQRLLRSDPDGVRAALARRGPSEPAKVDAFLALDGRRRELQTRVEAVRADRNAAAREIADAKSHGDDTSVPIARQAALKDAQAADERALSEAEAAIAELMVRIPNLPHPSVPMGSSEEDAALVSTFGAPPEFGFTPRDHLELAGPDGLGLIDTEAGARVSGS